MLSSFNIEKHVSRTVVWQLGTAKQQCREKHIENPQLPSPRYPSAPQRPRHKPGPGAFSPSRRPGSRHRCPRPCGFEPWKNHGSFGEESGMFGNFRWTFYTFDDDKVENGCRFGGFWSGQLTLSAVPAASWRQAASNFGMLRGVALEGRGVLVPAWRSEISTFSPGNLRNFGGEKWTFICSCCSTWWMNLLCWRGTSLTSIMVQSKGMWRVCWWRNCNRRS